LSVLDFLHLGSSLAVKSFTRLGSSFVNCWALPLWVFPVSLGLCACGSLAFCEKVWSLRIFAVSVWRSTYRRINVSSGLCNIW
jgi:hypothetical protein